MSASHHRGIRLGIWSQSLPTEPRYRVRIGRCLGLIVIDALTREWLDAYIEWHVTRGETERAADLRCRWLAARKVRI